jgi:hypothetical protein
VKFRQTVNLKLSGKLMVRFGHRLGVLISQIAKKRLLTGPIRGYVVTVKKRSSSFLNSFFRFEKYSLLQITILEPEEEII